MSVTWPVNMLSFSEAGGHPVNEDAFEVLHHPSDPDCWLCFLADGQGGRAGGASASRLACRTAAAAASQQPPKRLVGLNAWEALLQKADRAVFADPVAGFTTLIGLSIARGVLVGGSCGDSVVVVTSAGETPREVTAGQLKNPPVGSGMARFVPFAAKLVSPWQVLVMSDGVWKYVGWDRLVIAATSKRGQSLVEALQGAARLLSSGLFPDDFTLVAFGEPAVSMPCSSRGRKK